MLNRLRISMGITIQTIADKAGVSKATVSYVLNDRAGEQRIPEKTRARILNAAKKLNYRKNVYAKCLASGKTMTLGLVVPDIGHLFIVEIIKTIQRVASENGYHIIIGDANDSVVREKEYFNDFMERRVDGLIIMPSPVWKNSDLVDEMNQINIPFILLGREMGAEYNSIVSDRVQGAFLATEHLIRRGSRKIAHVISNPLFLPTQEKLKGYRKALEKYDIEFDENMIIETESSCEGGLEAGHKLLKIRPRPTAVFASNDEVAMGVLKSLDKSGIRVPEDISVVGYDNLNISIFANVSLTTVDQSQREMGQKAVELLLERIKDRKLKPEQIVLMPKLIVRES